MGTKKTKRDFIFIDESGDPSKKGSPYYICSLLHVSDANIQHLYSAVCSYRFLLDHYNELHSYTISVRALKKINKLLKKQKKYFQASAVFVEKSSYRGPYLDRFPSKRNPVLFRKYMYRQVIDLHFSRYKKYSSKIEIVLDRSELSQSDFSNLKYYISRYSIIPHLDCLTEVDSKYVDLLQLADLVCAQFKNFAITKKQETGFSYSFINYKDITLENSLGASY